MKAGALDRVLEIQRESTIDGPARTRIKVWATIATVRAQVIQQSTGEFLRDYGQAEQTGIVFRVRFIPGQAITTADRVLYQGAPHDIKEVKELGRRVGLEIRCERVAT